MAKESIPNNAPMPLPANEAKLLLLISLRIPSIYQYRIR
jgi:hypothetical protein